MKKSIFIACSMAVMLVISIYRAAPSNTVETDTDIQIPPKVELDAPPESPPPQEEDEEEYVCVLEESEKVSDAYLSDTLFVGDSRIDGLGRACFSSPATFFGIPSSTATQIDTRKGIIMTVDGYTRKLTITEAIKANGRQFKRVYMMYGINELGIHGGTKKIISGYLSAIDKVKALQPTAQICIMGVLPVSNAKEYVSGYSGVVANKKIIELNKALIEMAESIGAYYVDTYSIFATADGQFIQGVSTDGIHLTAAASKKMMAYVETHAIPEKKTDK